MFVWGILGVIFIYYLLPIFNNLYNKYYSPILIFSIYSVLFIIIVDYVESSIRLLKVKNR